MPLCSGSDRGRVLPRTTFPHRESELTSLRCSVTREPWPTDSGRQADMSAAEMPAGAAPERAPDWHSIEWKNVWRAWFKSRLQLRVAGVDARRATPPDPRPPRWGLAGYCQLDPSHPAIVTCEGTYFEPCPPTDMVLAPTFVTIRSCGRCFLFVQFAPHTPPGLLSETSRLGYSGKKP